MYNIPLNPSIQKAVNHLDEIEFINETKEMATMVTTK